ncbi:MAG: sigma-70 family RNA polymerase sigma factor [Planctomycetes bacterium]|nr:sigma-70 family RNA polymerase sigma factor [Planctomycetota bacterium]
MPAVDPLEALTRTMEPRLRSLARRMCGPGADDAAQEALHEIARAWPGFRGDSAPTTWAHRIAVRTLVHFAERQRRATNREPAASTLDLHLDETAVASFATEPFTALAAQERRQRVHAAIAALSPPLHAVLVLRVGEGMDYAAIAATLDLPLGTVKSRIAAATLRLAELLQNLQEDA